MMFGTVFRFFLTTAVILTSLAKNESAIEHSPWCHCRVQAQYTLLLPRPSPCQQHRRFYRSKLYLTLLLLLLAGDVELNPGPDLTSVMSGTQGRRSQPLRLSSGQDLSQEKRLGTFADDQSPPDILAECPRCNNVSRKKRRIDCNLCNREWHLTCVRLSRSQADALSCWWCPDCSKHGGSQSQPTKSNRAYSVHEGEKDGCNLAESLAKLKQSRRVVPRIPKGARIQAADALRTLLDAAVEEKTTEAWERLLKFPLAALAVPLKRRPRSDTPTLTSVIKRQISAYMEFTTSNQAFISDGASRNEGLRPNAEQIRSDGIDRLKRSVSAKLSDQDVRGAIRLLASSDVIAQSSDEDS